VKQAVLELAAIDVAVAGVPFAGTMPLAILELTGIPTAVGVVDPALALQQAIDDIAAVTAAVGQTCVWGRQWFALAASRE
jgi:hypothetical protein